MNLPRRHWLSRAGALCVGGFLAPWSELAADTLRAEPQALGAPDAHGVRVPPGFSVRLLATSGQRVAGSSHAWHFWPDGGATFATAEGGWVYVSNAELPAPAGGVGALRFDATGRIVAAYPILTGTARNCAGGPTPWGTWLSCEETEGGQVYECNPQHEGQGQLRPALGRFIHEAAVVDPATGDVYLTEDHAESRLYRFRPTRRGRLDAGLLEAAQVDASGAVRWHPVSAEEPCRRAETTAFARGEGAWFAHGIVTFTTTADHRVWAYDVARAQLEVVYDAGRLGPAGALRDPDNVTAHPVSGTLFIGEDADDMQLVMLARRGDRVEVTPVVQFIGHDDSEVAGPAFSPDGSRLYVSSQRGRDGKTGMTFEIAGPFAQL